MEQSSQTALAPRKARSWTAKEQALAEVACATGVSLAEVARLLDRGTSVVQRRLKPQAAEKHRVLSSQWKKQNLDRGRAASKRWYDANKLQACEISRRWRMANPEKRLQLHRDWVDKNRVRASEHWRRRTVRERTSRQGALNPITVEQRINRFRLFSDSCAYCLSLGHLGVDHVLPLRHGGLDEAGNIVPACYRCNSSKGARPVEEWYRRQPFFTEARWRKIQRHCPAAVAGQLPLALAS